MDHPFRTAAFGGFNRQDVLNYLENFAKQAAEKQEALQKQADALEEAGARQETELAQLREKADRLEQEGGELRAQLKRSEEDAQASRTACEKRTSELRAARQELEELRSRVAALEPDASAYAGLKDRTAGVELDAHRRAQAIQEQAESQAAGLRRQMKLWLEQVEREYGSLRARMEAAVSSATGELDKAGKCLERASGLLEEQEDGLKSLCKLCETPEAAARVQAPLPLEEQ